MNPFDSLTKIIPSHHPHHLDFNCENSKLYNNNPNLSREMEQFCKACEVNHNEIKQFIIMAEQEIVPQLCDDTQPLPSGDRETVLALMWYLTAQTCLTGEQHLRGAMRIEDEKGRITAYMEKCLQNDPFCPVYKRISTHMNEFGITNKGVEFEEGQLPGQHKKNILFMHLPGNQQLHTPGTAYIKFEDAGLPPFWKKGFRSYENFARFTDHTFNYLKSRIDYEHTAEYKERREDVPESYKSRFKSIIKSLHRRSARSSRSFLEGIGSENAAPYQQALNEANAFGISRMINVLILEINNPSNQNRPELKQAQLLLEELQNRQDEIRARGYKGEVKGDEAILPSLKQMNQKYDK